MKPAISVLLPAYNAENFIEPAVRSILGQTFGDFELLVINDGSTDQTLSILQKLAATDSRINLISRPNTGYVPALNEGLAQVQGDLIARMDADDISLPTRFEKQVAYMREHPECVLLGTHVAQMDPQGCVIGPMSDVTFGHDKINNALLRRGWPIVHPAVMMRTAAVRQVGGYRVELCPNEDHDLFLKLGEIGQLENLPEVLVHYRKHDASESTKKTAITATLMTKIIIDACRRRGIPVPAEAQPQPALPVSKLELHRGWAWNAVKHNNLPTARKYAWLTLLEQPWSIDSWRLSFCALRGR